MLLLALACTSPSDDTALPGDDTADTADTADTGEPTVEPPPYSGGTCPTLQEGTNRNFASGDAERKFEVVLPANPDGAPVVFAWHWLGGNARQIVSTMDLERWADELGFVIVAPDSSGENPYEWDFLSGPDGNADGLFFDDLVACVYSTWNVDLANLHATGMSAGGLWTTWLTLYKADVLASTAPMSGGVTAYVSPARPIPVLVTWGGPTDIYQGFSFDDASQTFSAGLQGDGHFVAECVHDGGHTIPAEAPEYIGTWFADHPGFVEPDPYAEGLPGTFPDWCGIP